MSMDREDHEMIAALIDRTFKARTPEEIREQRRYEIARDIFARYAVMDNATTLMTDAQDALFAADTFITELERTK